MKPPREYRDYLNDLVDGCRALISFVASMTLDEFLADQKTRFAVMRGFEMMGEAARHIPPEVKASAPDIPWSSMRGLRNHVVHGYFDLQEQKLFETIKEDLPDLLPKLEAIARQHQAR